ncbi:threonine--tRNA ligase, partial [candidate division WWE3 bacterium]|nr:threonine--tRNA ligase [candidate division WWE3 bacterium]
NQKVIEKLKDDPLMPLRHTAEHILHMSVQQLFPDTKKVMGPPIENGFYFDFDLEQSIKPEDFEAIEQKMREIVEADLPISRKEVNIEEAKQIFANNPYKLDTLNEIEGRGEAISLYSIGTEGEVFYDLDLCAGPHVQSTGQVKAFKLLSLAGAYYKGDENNKMLQRIYGTAFDSKQALDLYLEELEQRKENDHRKLNQTLDIFTMSELVGKGLVMYTPNGTIIKNELRDHLLKICKKHGAKEVNIPHMAKIDLYKVSGHAEKFADELFKVTSHYDEEFVLKPVNCPHHTQIYASRPRSYRDLPLAYVESTQQHRDEKPGAMVGLNRARSFEIDDGHTFCTPEQIKDEAIKMLHIMKEFYEVFGMWGKHWVSLSFRDPNTPDKYIGDNKGWETAQQILIEINEELNLNGKIMEGEAALYGPKIDIMLKDALGNDRQLGTVQIDFAMPARFGLTYTDRDGQEKTPVMMHRAILGSYHRFIANLLENTGGSLPAWLAPQQIEIIPIADKHWDYAEQVAFKLREQELRVEINKKDDTMQSKIRDAQARKVPYMFILGDKEEQNSNVSIRLRNGDNVNGISLEEAIQKITHIYLTKSQQLW